MANTTLISTKQFSEAVGLSAQHVSRLVRSGKIEPILTLPNGHHLFSTQQVQQFLSNRERAQELKDAQITAPKNITIMVQDVENQLDFGAVAA